METPNITHQQFYTQIEPNDMLDDLNMERIGSGPPDNLPQYKMDIYQYLNDISDLVRGERGCFLAIHQSWLKFALLGSSSEYWAFFTTKTRL